MRTSSTSFHWSNRFDVNRPILWIQKTFITIRLNAFDSISGTYLEYLWEKLVVVANWCLWWEKCIHFHWSPVAVSTDTMPAYRIPQNRWRSRCFCSAALSIRRSPDWPPQFPANYREISNSVHSQACAAHTGTAPVLFVRCLDSSPSCPARDRMHDERN